MVSRLLMSLRKAGDPNVTTAWDLSHFTGATATEPIAFGVNLPRGTRPEGTEEMGHIEMVDINLEDPYHKQLKPSEV